MDYNEDSELSTHLTSLPCNHGDGVCSRGDESAAQKPMVYQPLNKREMCLMG